MKDWYNNWGETKLAVDCDYVAEEAPGFNYDKCYSGSLGQSGKKCPQCNGKGRIPSDRGKQLLEFLKEYQK